MGLTDFGEKPYWSTVIVAALVWYWCVLRRIWRTWEMKAGLSNVIELNHLTVVVLIFAG